jgi:hypothetical protein
LSFQDAEGVEMNNRIFFRKLIGFGSALTLTFCSLVGFGLTELVFDYGESIESASAANIDIPDPYLKDILQQRIYENNAWLQVWNPKSETTTAIGDPPAGHPDDFDKEIYQDCTYSWYFQSGLGETSSADDYVGCDDYAPKYLVGGQDYTSTTWKYEIDQGHYLWASKAEVPLNDETATYLTRLTVYGNWVFDPPSQTYVRVNPIKSLAGLNRFTGLTDITLYYEDFSTFDPNWLTGLTNLTRLNLNYSLMSTIPKFNLPTLTYLNLSNNQITEVTDDAFSGLPILDSIVLDGNRISKLTDIPFKSSTISHASLIDQSVSMLGIRDAFFSPIELKNQTVYLQDLQGIVEPQPGEYGLTEASGSGEYYVSFKNSFTATGCVAYDFQHSCTNFGPVTYTNRIAFGGSVWVYKANSVVVKLPNADGTTYKFTDVNSKKVGKDRAASITWLARTGITVGAGCDSSGAGKNCKFMPKSQVNRGSMAQFLQKLAGVSDAQLANDVGGFVNNFTDLNKLRFGKTANIARYNAIVWLAHTDITAGCDALGTKFCPDDAVNRGAMAQFMQRFANVPNVPNTDSQFPDVNIVASNIKYEKSKQASFVDALSAARVGAINWLANRKITLGSSYTTIANKKVTTFRPQDAVTRGAMAQFMQNLYNVLKAQGF